MGRRNGSGRWQRVHGHVCLRLLHSRKNVLSLLSFHAPGASRGSIDPSIDANASCTQCHQEAEYNERIESHTFHSGESSGSECMNCHMPHTTYALFNAIRSHQIASPQVASLEHGVPNACNLCHLDQTLAWTQSHLVDRYGHEALEMPLEHRETAASILWDTQSMRRRELSGPGTWGGMWPRRPPEVTGSLPILPFFSTTLTRWCDTLPNGA